MNYVLYNSDKLPEHINDCISNIKNIDSGSKIYLSSDMPTNIKGVVSIENSKIASSQTKKLIERNIYKGTNYEKNPLWQASLVRIFILRDIVKKYELEDIIHFDNDVLIYIEAKKLIKSSKTVVFFSFKIIFFVPTLSCIS